VKEKMNQEIQVLRAIAILIVVLHHSVGLFFWDTHKWEAIGGGMWVGVDLFFCVSGYVIAKGFLPRIRGKEGIDFWRETGAFWLRRLYRITPSAWLWVVLPMVIGPFLLKTVGSGQFTSGNLADAASIALHVQNFHAYQCSVGGGPCGDFATYWTLSLEEQFYLLLPFVVLLSGRRLVPTLVVLVVAQFFFSRPQWGNFLAFVRTDAILLGVLIAIFSETDVYKALDPKLTLSKFRFIIPPLLVFCLIAAARYGIVSFYTGIVALVSALIVWICSYNKGYFMRDSVFRKALAWVGSRSYAIYLIHNPVYWATREIWLRIEPSGTQFNDGFTLRFALTAIPMIFILAELNFRFVEEPLRRKGSAKARRVATPDEAAIANA
jgi:peptidoglycan/LPS O-acetylase OafA/YrhL